MFLFHFICLNEFLPSRAFGPKCSGCGSGILPSDIIRRAHEYVYHVDCFNCIICGRKLDTGDEFFLMEDKKLLCKQDFEAAKSKGGYAKQKESNQWIYRLSCGERTIISVNDILIFKVKSSSNITNQKFRTFLETQKYQFSD